MNRSKCNIVETAVQKRRYAVQYSTLLYTWSVRYYTYSKYMYGALGGTLNIYWCGCAAANKKGGLRNGHTPKRGLLGTGTTPKRGVLGTGQTHFSVTCGGGGYLR